MTHGKGPSTIKLVEAESESSSCSKIKLEIKQVAKSVMLCVSVLICVPKCPRAGRGRPR